jgi:hypothetical protein
MVANSDMAVCLAAVRPDLMALCYQLEQQLSHTEQQRRRLLLAWPCSNASASRDSSRFATPRYRVHSKAWDRELLNNFMLYMIVNP